MGSIQLPTRTGPRNGTFAFTPEDEVLIYEAVTKHGMRKIQVAATVDASLPTIDAIIRRVEARNAGAGAREKGGRA